MASRHLFDSPNGPVTAEDVQTALLSVGANECQVLYIHTGLTFGTPAAGLSRYELLDALLDTIRGLNVATVCMPTFTFSFCNGEIFDRQQSKSQMGALNEHFRSQPDAERSLEPLMSVAAIGSDLDLVRELGEQSIGSDSTFDKLAHRDDVRFLFLGVRPGACFTYMHYLEWKAGVPYRYDRPFTGEVISDGKRSTMTKQLFVRYNGVFATEKTVEYEHTLLDVGHLHNASLGASTVSCVPLDRAEEIYLELLAGDPNYFITEPFDRNTVDTSFAVKNMVAL